MTLVVVTLALIFLITLIVWRLVFAALQRRPLMMSESSAPQRQNNGFMDLEAVVALAGNRFNNNSSSVGLHTREDRAKAYLRRIVALTGATQTGNAYVLDVGNTSFHVRDGYVSRLKDVRDPKCTHERTCFSVPYKDMPKKEQIASALLQLRSNPALFDRWAAQIGALKADGQGFSPPE
jgi:hypothetical protein